MLQDAAVCLDHPAGSQVVHVAGAQNRTGLTPMSWARGSTARSIAVRGPGPRSAHSGDTPFPGQAAANGSRMCHRTGRQSRCIPAAAAEHSARADAYPAVPLQTLRYNCDIRSQARSLTLQAESPCPAPPGKGFLRLPDCLLSVRPTSLREHSCRAEGSSRRSNRRGLRSSPRCSGLTARRSCWPMGAAFGPMRSSARRDTGAAWSRSSATWAYCAPTGAVRLLQGPRTSRGAPAVLRRHVGPVQR